MIGWLAIFGLPALAIVCFIADNKYRYSTIRGLLGMIFLALSAFAWLMWPISYIETVGMIASHQATGETMRRARANDWEGFERATLQREIVKTNRDLRYYQAMDKFWDPYIPDEIHSVEPVE